MSSRNLLFTLLVAACTAPGNEPGDDAGVVPGVDGAMQPTPDAAPDAPSCLPANEQTFYRDVDGDGFGGSTSTRACVAPSGYVTSNTDCDDSEAAVNPSATEVCDSIDNDCDDDIDMADASLDTSTATTYYRDMDNDTFGGESTMLACSQPSGYVTTQGDCDDASSATKPGALELCDARDNDCDGGIDGTSAQPNQCTARVGTYTGSYSHLTQEKVGSIVVNSMQCSGTGSATLVLARANPLQGTFTCTYTGGLTLFTRNQTMTLRGNIALDGTVTGTVEHNYDGFSLKRTYNVTGTQTGTQLALTATSSWLPHPMSAVPWTVELSVTGSR